MIRRSILVVDDQMINRKILGKILETDYEVLYAQNGEQAMEMLGSNPDISAVLLDIVMPVMDGYQVLTKMRESDTLSKIPVIVSSQKDGDEAEVKALSLGAYDFIAKPYKADIILHRLHNMIRFRETASMVNKMELDELTGLYNKQFFFDKVRERLEKYPEESYDMLCLGVERFKLVNDTYGEDVGNKVLCHIAKVLRENCQPIDLCTRFSGDEFYAVIPYKKERDNEYLFHFYNLVNEYPIDMEIKIHCGLYTIQGDEKSINTICDRAKLAADSNRGKYDRAFDYYDDSLRQKLMEEQFLTSHMYEALEQKQFQVYYQPKYDLNNETIAGAEALVRWIHPEKGFLSPGAFIPLFERNGFITQLDEYVWETVCRDMQNWIEEGYPPIAVSVNVSRADIYNVKLSDILTGLIDKYRIPIRYLHLEITESAYTDNPEQIISVVHKFRELGFIIEMDDFGSGYSSLNMLAQMPIDVLKLDIKFIQMESKNTSGKGILSFVISLAKWLNLAVVAEGVETKEQIRSLRSMDCNYVQGFYYAKPMPLVDFRKLLRSSHTTEMVCDGGSGQESAVVEHFDVGEEQKLTMMIVDDIEVNRAVLAATFMDEYHIIEKENGKEAWDYLEKNSDGVDVILLDLLMPVMDGFQLLKKIRSDSRTKELSVIITSQGDEDSEARAIELNADDFISKPYKPDMIRHRVHNVVYSSKYQYAGKLTIENICRIVDCMPGEYLVCQADGLELKYWYYTKGIPALSGHTQEEYDQIEDVFELILEEDRIMMREKITRCLENHEFQEMDFLFRLNHIQKGFIWVHLTVKNAWIVDGQPVYLASLWDVTKETMLSYALMESSNRLICVIEKSTKRFLYANSAFYDLVDSNPSDAMGKHCYQLLCKVMEMKDNDNCFCYSSIDADPPLEMYNPEKQKYFTLTGKEITWGEYNAYVFYMTDITEMKHREAQLEDSNKRFNVALDNCDLMIWEYDIVNHRCINSEKAGRDYNIPLVIENYPESLFETGYTPPETVAQIKEVQQRLLNGETGFSVERRTVDKYGESNWQKVEYTLECDAQGKPLRAIVCGLDITAQKELEQKYKQQMEYRNKFAENAMFSVCLDLDNDEILDYTCTDPILRHIAEEAKGSSSFFKAFFETSVFDADSDLSREKLTSEALRDTYALGQSQYRTTYRCRLLNLYLDLNLSIYKNPGTGHLEVFFVIIDVTDGVLKRNALQSVVNKDYDFVIFINADSGKMTTLAHSKNAVMPKLSEKNSDDYDSTMMEFARDHKDIYFKEEDFYAVSEGMKLAAIKEKLEQMPVYEFNCRTVDAAKQIQTFRLSFSYLNELKNQIIFTRANITEAVQEERFIQQQLEDALKEAKKADQAKTDFLSRMSHDMRTPMNGIIGMTRLTQDLEALPAEALDNLAAIRESSDYLLQLINDTLDMNKIESNRFTLKPEVIHAGKLIERTITNISFLAEKKDIQVEFEPINAQLEYIRADRVRLQQLFMNLLSNAVKFTSEGGHVRFIVECLRRERGIAYDRIVVEDNGRGMSQEFLSHIFEPFSQERNESVKGQEGTGLGMTIVKNLVDQMGGKIEIESTPGKGTRVIVYLAFERVYEVPESFESEETDIRLEGKKILLAEDHPLNALITRRLLQKKGIILDHVENGKQAVDIFEKSELYSYDGILMDIRMPVMNGLEAAAKIRQLDRVDAKEVPIIAMTANAYDDDVKQALAAGMNAHLPKPVEPEKLYAVLSSVICKDR